MCPQTWCVQGIPVAEQILVFAGKQLDNDLRINDRDLGLQKESTLFLIHKPPAHPTGTPINAAANKTATAISLLSLTIPQSIIQLVGSQVELATLPLRHKQQQQSLAVEQTASDKKRMHNNIRLQEICEIAGATSRWTSELSNESSHLKGQCWSLMMQSNTRAMQKVLLDDQLYAQLKKCGCAADNLVPYALSDRPLIDHDLAGNCNNLIVRNPLAPIGNPTLVNMPEDATVLQAFQRMQQQLGFSFMTIYLLVGRETPTSGATQVLELDRMKLNQYANMPLTNLADVSRGPRDHGCYTIFMIPQFSF